VRRFLRDSEGVTPERLIRALPMVFRSDRAGDLRALYRIDIAGQRPWWVRVADGACQVTDSDPGEEADVRFAADPDTWVGLANGTRRRLPALLLRRLRVQGDRRKAQLFERLFT
jgi:putative sterol carrier protein